MLSAPDDSYPDAIIDENIAKKALSWKTDPSKIFLSIKVTTGNLCSFIFDKRIYLGEDVDIDLDGDTVEEVYTSTIFVPSEDGLVAITCRPTIDRFGPAGTIIKLEINIQQYPISATKG